MKTRFIILAALLFGTGAAFAQETYENAKIATQDLNGTARYVGMGGAMEALGADISTISTNPAGIGMFRRSTVSGSFGVVSQQDADDFANGHTTNASFDQIGFVYSSHTDRNAYVNFAFNYHKSRNFNYILSAADNLSNASQNKLTYAKQKNGLLYPTDSEGAPLFNNPYVQCNQLDDIYARNLNYSTDDNTWYYDPATAYTLNRAHKGYIGEYDINLSGNVNDRFYWGFTIGYQDVNYRHYGEYTEQLDGFAMQVQDERHIDGRGVDVKAGVIFRPVVNSPFRIGLSVATPTFYDLTTENYTSITDGSNTVSNGEALSYKICTPWKFGLSLGHTVGNYLALGASYEYADYGNIDSRYDEGGYYDYWDGVYYDTSSSDEIMNNHTEGTLKGVSTLKLGVELKAMPDFAVRLGYNYVSPMYNEDGFKNGTLDSQGSYYSSATDYTNWKATNRITAGLGYTYGKFIFDVAYQFSSTKGEFSPFMSYFDNDSADEDNIPGTVDVFNKRHQLLCTIGYRF